MTEPNGASGANGANGDGAGKGQAPVLRNHVAIILDESGSMNAMRQEAMDAFNQQVEAIRAGALG